MVVGTNDNFVTTCTETLAAGTRDLITRTCITGPPQTSLWVDLAPMFALAAGIYGALGGVADYLEFRDKNFKELLSSESTTNSSSAQVYKRVRLRVGQHWQWMSKTSSGFVALSILTAYFFTERGPTDMTAWLAATLATIVPFTFFWFRHRTQKSAVADAGLFKRWGPQVPRDETSVPLVGSSVSPRPHGHGKS